MSSVGSIGLKRRARVLVSIAAGLSAIVIILSLMVTGDLQSFSSSIVAIKDNPLGVEARVAFVHENTAMSCPFGPCDSSGFVLKVISKNADALLQGYDVCKAGGPLFAPCAHSDDLGYSLVTTPQFPNEPDEWGNAIGLQRKSHWKVGDIVDIKVKVAAAGPAESRSEWIELGESPILEFERI